jgi:uncharacterized membrane protein (UPF0136 family)
MPLLVVLFGLAVVGGGVVGFVSAGSWVSLVAGGALGLGLVASGWALRRGGAGARTAAALLALAVAGVMAERYVRTEKAMPAIPVGGAGLVLAIALALARPPRP